MWHPAALLITWLGLVLFLQQLPFEPLLAVAVVMLAVAFAYAPQRSRRLLWRSRWLLLSLCILFAFFTPGEYLPGLAGKLGITREGLQHAGEQLARLVAMLASLALLHEQLGTAGLLAGLYALLAPFRWRERTVVRLMLVLDTVENAPRGDWRAWLAPADETAAADERLTLAYRPFRARDGALVLAVIAGLVLYASRA